MSEMQEKHWLDCLLLMMKSFICSIVLVQVECTHVACFRWLESAASLIIHASQSLTYSAVTWLPADLYHTIFVLQVYKKLL